MSVRIAGVALAVLEAIDNEAVFDDGINLTKPSNEFIFILLQSPGQALVKNIFKDKIRLFLYL